MSSLRQRADRLVANENKLSEGLPKKRMGVAKVEAAWKRLTVRILVMLATARQQMVVDEFYVTEEPKEKASSSHEAKPKRRANKNSQINQGIGQPLARSKAHKTFAVEPQSCQHPPDKLRCRANAISQWWTCTLCGSRWQRNDTVETINDPLPKTSENEPKIMGRRGQEFPKFLPAKGFDFGVFQRDGWDRIYLNAVDEDTAADRVDNRKVTFSHEDNIARDTDDSTPQEEHNTSCHRDLRDQFRRGDNIGRGDGTHHQAREVRPRVLLDAASISASSPAPLRKLRKELQSQGWVVKTLLLLITWAGNDWSQPLPNFLGPPRFRMDWSNAEQEWLMHSETSNTPSRSTTWCCYVFEDKMQKFNWVLDSSGHQASDVRDQNVKAINKATRENLVTQGKSLVGTTPVKENELATIGQAVDLHLGWNFNREEHRRAALHVINVVDTYYNVQFSMSLAQMQLSGNRGFIVEHPSQQSLLLLEPLTNDSRVYVLSLQPEGQGDRNETVLVTNLEFVPRQVQKRLSLRPWPGSAPKHLDVFVEFLLDGIRKHVKLKHHPLPQLDDNWRVTPCHLICRHFRPRLQLVTPQHCRVFNIKDLKFTGKRITEQHFVGLPSKIVTDDWRSGPSELAPMPWSGATFLELEPQTLLPSSYHNYATWLTASLAHHLHSFQVEEAAFQREWLSIFPSHNILGEEARANRADRAQSSGDFQFESDKDPDQAEIPDLETEAQTDRVLDQGLAMEVDSVDEAMVRNELRDLKVPHMPENIVEDPNCPSPPADIRREIYRLHRNLGHPDNITMTRALKHAGVKNEYLRWIRKQFVCPICKQKKPPAQHRPAHLAARALPFNEVVGVDLFFIDRKIFLNMICWGTNYQVVEIIEDKSSASVALAMARSWLAHYGSPMMVICDQGTEFTGKDFVDLMTDNGTVVHFTDTASPWQNSRTEKAGGIFKSRLAKVCQDAAVTSETDYRITVAQTALAHNMYYDRSGFSPQQRVFGTNLRVAPSLLSDGFVDQDLLQAPRSDFMKRSAEIREAATKAWMERQDYEAVVRAVKTNARTVDAIPINAGDRVYVWRTTPEFRGWSGPGVVIQTTENGRSLWISLRGYLLKASREQTRLATTEENFGTELRKVLAKGMLEDFEKGNLKHYRDIQNEGLPDENVEGFENSDYAPSEAEELSHDEAVQLGLQPFDSPGTNQNPPLAAIPEEDATMEPEEGSTRPPSEAQPSVPPSATASRRSSIRVDEASSGEMVFGPTRETRRPPMPYPMSDSVPSWPSPGQPQNYLEVMHGEADTDKVKWWTDKARNRKVPLPSSKVPFAPNEAHAMYSHREKKMFLSKKVDPPGHVDFRRLPEQLKKVFRRSRDKEIKSLLDSGAIKILSLAESLQFEREHPDHVLTSRYVDRWKPSEDGATLPDQFDAYDTVHADSEVVAPKSRWTVVGWRDPEVHAIERSAPTPLTTSIYLAMQTASTKQWKAFVRDVKTAFLQSMPTTRKQKLAVRMPSCEHFPTYDSKQLILLLTEIYGLVSGPAWWRRSLLNVLVRELGYTVSPYDRCVLILKADPAEKLEDQTSTQGIIVIEVDDVLEAGGERHRLKMKALESRFRFGKVTSLMDSESGSGYAGRRLKQRSDYSFTYSMSDYVSNRLKYVEIARKVLKKDSLSTKLTPNEESQLRGVIAALNWAAREGRPDASAAASILAGCFPSPTMADVIAVNQVVQFAKAKKVDLVIHSIPQDQVRHVVISDSAFDPTGKTKPQHGWLQGITSPALNRGELAPVSLMAWKSRRMKRKAGNTLLCESIALSTDDQEEDSPTVLATEDPRYIDPKSIAVADAKSLFDALHAEQSHGDDDRSALEIAIIQQSLLRLRGRIRWVPHNENPADGLTKLAGAHMEPMYRLLQTNKYAIEQEETVLSRGHPQALSLEWCAEKMCA
ncbi:GIP [Symbiodinium sp. KB8]|nr:GIP [Symbiodinium sp. KB8]